MPVLVAYANKHGSTQGIAERIAAILRRAGSRWTLPRPKTRVTRQAMTLRQWQRRVASRWMAPASEFIRHHGAPVTDRPVCLFSVGPVGRRIPLPATLPPVLAAPGDSSGAQDHHVFRRAIDAGKLRGVEHLIRLFLPQGDFRNWPDIEAWATGIASELRRTRPPHAPGSDDRDRPRPFLEGL